MGIFLLETPGQFKTALPAGKKTEKMGKKREVINDNK